MCSINYVLIHGCIGSTMNIDDRNRIGEQFKRKKMCQVYLSLIIL